MTAHTLMIEQAIDAALLGPEADPNPRVGAVILDPSGNTVGVGHHRGAGTVHAEVDALQQAGPRAQGGTAYVTLEPCLHHGRTQPCTDALLSAGIASVVYASPDPTQQAGGGAVALQQQGIQVLCQPHPAAEALIERWSHSVRHRRPWVTVKMASTLDGRSAAKDGSSAWITSPQARTDGHELRAVCGAVMVGTGTVVADNPSLTARYSDGELRERQPWRVIVGRRPLPQDAQVFSNDAATRQLASHDVNEVMTELYGSGIRRVLVEGGPTLIAALWRAGVVDEVIAYIAPALLGGGLSAIGDLGIDSMQRIARLELVDVTQIGPDVRLTSRPIPSANCGRQPTNETTCEEWRSS